MMSCHESDEGSMRHRNSAQVLLGIESFTEQGSEE